MTRQEMVAELRKRATKERKCAKEFRTWISLRVAGGQAQSDRWAQECEAEALFLDGVAEALGEG